MSNQTDQKISVLEWINMTLHNDEASSDDELIGYFMFNGLSRDQAGEAVDQRNKCLNDMHYKATVKGVRK